MRWSTRRRTYTPWVKTGLIPDLIAQPLRGAGSWLIVLAMAGLGLGVRLSAVRSVRPRVGVAVVVSLASMIGLTLLLLRALGIDAA